MIFKEMNLKNLAKCDVALADLCVQVGVFAWNSSGRIYRVQESHMQAPAAHTSFTAKRDGQDFLK